VKTEESLNTMAVGNFITFLKSSETQNFDIGRGSYELLKLREFLGYDFQFEPICKSILSFFCCKFH
jgi:hypothetical protein